MKHEILYQIFLRKIEQRLGETINYEVLTPGERENALEYELERFLDKLIAKFYAK